MKSKPLKKCKISAGFKTKCICCFKEFGTYNNYITEDGFCNQCTRKVNVYSNSWYFYDIDNTVVSKCDDGIYRQTRRTTGFLAYQEEFEPEKIWGW